MDIYAKEGTKVKYIEDYVGDASVNWGSHEDPRGVLKDGKIYTIDRTEVHSWHTKVFLKGYEDKSYNSVWFEDE
jgi:hypothetical protein